MEGENGSGAQLPPVVDAQQCLDLAGGNPALAQELLQMLVDALPGLCEALDRAHDRRERAALREAAHRMAGATAYCGVPALRRAAERLEQELRAGGPSVETLIEAVKREARRVMDSAAAGPVL